MQSILKEIVRSNIIINATSFNYYDLKYCNNYYYPNDHKYWSYKNMTYELFLQFPEHSPEMVRNASYELKLDLSKFNQKKQKT
jgi:hypothetical protein